MGNKGFQGRLFNTTALVAVFAGGLMATPALAQNAETASSDSTDIVVTAQRREEKAKDVPITLTAITAEKLGQGDVQQLADIAKLTPALRFDNYGGFAQPTIRGVGTAVSASGAGSNVGIYVDGFYSPNPLSNDFQLLNVSGVTVLKGPQGTLFGRNSTGGAIQVSTTDPSADTSGVVEASYGRFNAQRYQGYFTTGLNESVAIDIAGLYRKGNGYVRNIVTGSKKDAAYDNWAIRTGLKVEVSPTISFLLRYTHAKTDDPTSLVDNSYVENGQTLSVGAIIPGAVTANRPYQVSNTSKTHFDSEVDAVQLTGRFDLGWAMLTSYTQYRSEGSNSFLDLEGSNYPVFDVDFFITDKVFTQEFLLASQGESRLKWTLGAFYFADDNRFQHLNGYVAGGPPGLISKSQTDTRSAAVFADLTYEAMDNLFVTAGLRYSHDQVKNGGFFLGPLAGNLGFVPIPSIKDDRLTPRFVLRYKPSDATSVYASFSMAHKAGILNPNGFTTVPVKPETIKSYEIGFKYSENGLTADLSAYHYDYTNLQVASYNGTQALINNAANSRVNGVEGQVAYRPSRDIEFSMGAAYTDGKYTKFPGSPAFYQCLVPACGAGFGLFPTTSIDASGFRMARTPKFTGNIGARYSTDLAGGRFALSGKLSYTSKVYFDSSQQFSQKGYELASLRAEWTDPSEHFTLAIYGDNLTKSKYYSQVLPGQFAIQTVWGAPLTYGGSVRVKF